MARSSSFRVTGVQRLHGRLRRNANLQDIKNIVRMNGSELERLMKRNANFIRGYSIGDTKRSIRLTPLNNGFGVKVGPTTEYSSYLEYGTRYMTAQPFIYPSFTVQKMKFINDLRRIVR